MRTIDKGFYWKININIEISETELNVLARKHLCREVQDPNHWTTREIP